MSAALTIETGSRFERLTVIREVERKRPTTRRFELLCDCGAVTHVDLNHLRHGLIRSCGCLRTEVLKLPRGGSGKIKRKTKDAVVQVGQAFGRWTVLCRATNSGCGNVRWICRCECGIVAIVIGNSLHRKISRSCGCLSAELARTRTTHGLRRSREYGIWASIKQRCTNPATSHYLRYGGRGITLCTEWSDSFEAFYAHVGPAPGSAFQIDRINNDLGYEPGNVRWATIKQQARNKSGTVRLTFDGKTQSIADWSELTGISPSTLYSRVKRRRRPTEEILSTQNCQLRPIAS
jgi:hypothetical protein